MSSEQANLRPCPHCQSTLLKIGKPFNSEYALYTVTCESCHATSAVCASEEGAVILWNRRRQGDFSQWSSVPPKSEGLFWAWGYGGSNDMIACVRIRFDDGTGFIRQNCAADTEWQVLSKFLERYPSVRWMPLHGSPVLEINDVACQWSKELPTEPGLYLLYEVALRLPTAIRPVQIYTHTDGMLRIRDKDCEDALLSAYVNFRAHITPPVLWRRIDVPLVERYVKVDGVVEQLPSE